MKNEHGDNENAGECRANADSQAFTTATRPSGILKKSATRTDVPS